MRPDCVAALPRSAVVISVREEESPREGRKLSPPVHDDLVQREFVAAAPNELWLSDMTEHWTGEGKLYLCAVKDVRSNRLWGTPSTLRWLPRLR